MSRITKMVMKKFYREAEDDPTRLPWHRDGPGPLLQSAIDRIGGAGHALDVGCGAGIHSIWLARRGLVVTGIDMFPEATNLAREQARHAGVEADFVTTDLYEYAAPEGGFDLVYDSGCLHSLVGGDLLSYKQRILSWLAPEGQFVLEHWGKRHAFDWRPIGPRRRSQAAIEGLFQPELVAKEVNASDFAAPLPFGPTVQGASYRFLRRGATA